MRITAHQTTQKAQLDRESWVLGVDDCLLAAACLMCTWLGGKLTMAGITTARPCLPVLAVALLPCHLCLASNHGATSIEVVGGQVGRGMWHPWRGELSRAWQPCSPRTAACTTNLKLMLSRSACTHANMQQQCTFLHLMHLTISVQG